MNNMHLLFLTLKRISYQSYLPGKLLTAPPAHTSIKKNGTSAGYLFIPALPMAETDQLLLNSPFYFSPYTPGAALKYT
jgi:hypothetical protein